MIKRISSTTESTALIKYEPPLIGLRVNPRRQQSGTICSQMNARTGSPRKLSPAFPLVYTSTGEILEDQFKLIEVYA